MITDVFCVEHMSLLEFIVVLCGPSLCIATLLSHFQPQNLLVGGLEHEFHFPQELG